MRLWLPMLLCAAILAAGAGSAFAVSSLAGPTGLVILPTADIAPTTDWQIGIGQYSYQAQAMYDVSDWSFNLIKGVADDAELFLRFQRISGEGGTDAWEYGGKYLLSQSLFPRQGFLGGTKVAFGASLGRWANSLGMYDRPDVETLRAYLVATKQIKPYASGDTKYGEESGTRVVVSAGLMYLRAKLSEGDSDTLLRPFLGLQVYGSRNLEFLTEYRLKASDLESDPVFSVAIRKPFGSSTTFELGLTNADAIGLGMSDQNMYARLIYTWPTEGYQ